MESRLRLSMADERPCTFQYCLHVEIASHHTRLPGRVLGHGELLFSNFSLTCSEVVYGKQENQLSAITFTFTCPP